MTKLSGFKNGCAVILLCAATAIAAPAQTFTTLFLFNSSDGIFPIGLVQGTDGNFYGPANLGGEQGWGTVYRTDPGGLTALYSFCSQKQGDMCLDGQEPDALILATDLNFYGTTYAAGAGGYGTVFKITSGGTLTTLYSFGGVDSRPYGLVQADDGNLYGTTDGPFTGGTVFKITPDGTLTTLYNFDGAEGGNPNGPLIQSTDGNLYGTTFYGGFGNGTVFKITLGGTLTTLYSFCPETPCIDGRYPAAGLAMGTDGNFYGTTRLGGLNYQGTVFKITPGGKLTRLHSFCLHVTCEDGAFPTGLIQATDGNLWGITTTGGAHGFGTIFAITPRGVLTTVYNFCSEKDCADGQAGTLMQATDGNFYGTNYYYGVNSDGTIYRLSTGLGPFVTFVRAAGKVGQTGPILGQGFTGTTNVAINGIPGTFTVVSDTFIRATVPEGATTGYVTVTTPSGTLTSNVPFHVIK
jgi:uncharacterized repeat protein (TIGR03803 family)